MVRVLVVAKDLQLHGISKVIMNYFDYINKDEIQMDFAVGKPIEDIYKNTIEKTDSKLFVLPSKSKNPIGYYKELNYIMKKNKYDILHIHGNSATITAELLIGKLNKIPTRIPHSHNTTCNHKIIHTLLKKIMKLFYTQGFACGEMAGKWMFGNEQFEIIRNCFDTKQYKYDETKRNMYRDKLNLQDEFVVGHVGFFNEQKNHRFIVDVFNELAKVKDNSKLLLIGDGYTKKDIKDYAKKLNLSDKIIFYGTTNDVAGMMSAMDLFLLPSLYEGLPIVLLESQISGLPCLLSDVISSEAKLGENFYKMSLEQEPKKWVEKILDIEMISNDREKFYDENKEAILEYEYRKVSDKLNSLYKKLSNKES